MIKHFCDHCGKEIEPLKIYTLDNDGDNLFYDEESNNYIGYNKELCQDCYSLRIKKHLELDKEFFKSK